MHIKSSRIRLVALSREHVVVRSVKLDLIEVAVSKVCRFQHVEFDVAEGDVAC